MHRDEGIKWVPNGWADFVMVADEHKNEVGE
jgi:hypothetical protein